MRPHQYRRWILFIVLKTVGEGLHRWVEQARWILVDWFNICIFTRRTISLSLRYNIGGAGAVSDKNIEQIIISKLNFKDYILFNLPFKIKRNEIKKIKANKNNLVCLNTNECFTIIWYPFCDSEGKPGYKYRRSSRTLYTFWPSSGKKYSFYQITG